MAKIEKNREKVNSNLKKKVNKPKREKNSRKIVNRDYSPPNTSPPSQGRRNHKL